MACYSCSICGSTYSYRSGLSRHKKTCIETKSSEISDIMDAASVGNIKCHFTGCDIRFISSDDLIKHLSDVHNEKVNIDKKTFATMEEFTTWKADFETCTSSNFVLHCAPKKRLHYLCYYYYCNRSGSFNSRGKGKRSLKLQGSSKIGSNCIAFIRARQQYSSGEVEAEICDYHLHEAQLAHLRLPESTRQMIAAKLHDGVSINAILDSIRDGVHDIVGRAELTCRQDIHNIRQQYNIEGIQYHKNDHCSVHMWVENAKSKADIPSPVLLYKQQDVEQTDELNDFSKSDFAIGIQTTFQRDMLMKFGGEAICMDSTHSTNVYDFCLVTILVLDDFGEGVPVGWMISNREDAAALRQFLLKVRNVCGDIQAKVFMSDDADNFYNAWKSIFTVSKTKKLICAWHIDKSWRKGVQEHVTVKSKQAEVNHHLRVLLEEVTKGTFHLRLQQFISWLSNDDDSLPFLDYFKKQYVPKIEQWAPCYRGATIVNTNMAIESFHRLLKVCYLDKKQNRRVDHLLHILLKISRDKTFERLQKTQKGKLSYRISEVNKRHRTAQNMNASEVIISHTGATWRIKPTVSDSQEKFYTVEKISDACSCSCRIRCSTCNVCVHSYSCTCMDYLIHSTICKHIHLVEISFNNVENIIAVDDTCTINEERISLDVQPIDELEAPSTELLTEDTCSIETPDISSLQYLTHQIHNQDSVNDVSVMQEKAISICKKVELVLRDCTNIEAIKAGKKHLNAAFTVIKSLESRSITELPVAKRPASNALSETQLRFYSTKKKRKVKPRLPKPNLEEVTKCLEDFEEVEVEVCGICFTQNDHKMEINVDWIQCQLCDIWFHQSCVSENCEFDDSFICNYCIAN